MSRTFSRPPLRLRCASDIPTLCYEIDTSLEAHQSRWAWVIQMRSTNPLTIATYLLNLASPAQIREGRHSQKQISENILFSSIRNGRSKPQLETARLQASRVSTRRYDASSFVFDNIPDGKTRRSRRRTRRR